MSCMMYDMRVSVRELQRELRAVIDRVASGEPVEITRRGRLVARLLPAQAGAPEPWPDLAARAREVLGDRRISPAPSQQLAADRGER